MIANTVLEKNKIFYRRRVLVAMAFSVLIQVVMSASAAAEVNGPGWFLGDAKPVSPEEANAYYEARSTQKMAKTLSTSGGMITAFSSTWPRLFGSIPPSSDSLAVSRSQG